MESNNSNEEFLSIEEDYSDLEEELMLSVAVSCSDLKLYQQSTILFFLTKELKARIQNKTFVLEDKRKESRESYRKLWCTSAKLNTKLEEFVKCFLNLQKMKIIAILELALDCFRKVNSQLIPIMNNKMHPKFARQIYEVIEAMLELNDNQSQEELAKTFWIERKAKRKGKVIKRMKGVIIDMIYYSVDVEDPFYIKAVKTTLAKTLIRICRVKWIFHHIKWTEMMKVNEEKNKEMEEKGCRRYMDEDKQISKDDNTDTIRENIRACIEERAKKHRKQKKYISNYIYGWLNGDLDDRMESEEFRMQCFHEMMRKPTLIVERLERANERPKKRMMKLVEDQISFRSLNFLIAYYKEHKNNIDICFEVTKEIVATHLKPGSLNFKQHKQIVAKIVNDAVILSEGKNPTRQYFTSFATNYIKFCFCNQPKEQIKKAKQCFQLTLQKNGTYEENMVRAGSSWGTIAYFKEVKEYEENNCKEFVNKWDKSFMPIVKEALTILKDLLGGFHNKENKEQAKLIENYLKLTCSDGNFDLERYKAFLIESKERTKRLVDKYMSINPEMKLL